jgi:hypothetical protein
MIKIRICTDREEFVYEGLNEIKAVIGNIYSGLIVPLKSPTV